MIDTLLIKLRKNNMIITKDKYLIEVGILPKPDIWQSNTAAMDLRIGLEIYNPNTKETFKFTPGDYITINPGEHFLIQTLEKITLPNNIVAVVYPRSGTNRKGITVDMTGIVDPGYSGHLMIPVTNTMKNRPVLFLVGERIAQIVFTRTETINENIRESKYQNSSMEAKPDKQEEKELLMNGDLIRNKKI